MRFVLGLLAFLFFSAAQAQEALVVQTCGTLPLAYAVGSTQKATVDVNGRMCGSPVGLLKYCLAGVNFNSANTDNPITISMAATRYSVNSIRITNASATLSTATIGVFTATGGGGQTLAANQAITVTQSATDTNNNTQALALTQANTEAYNDTTLQIRIGTAQGAPGTGDVCLYLFPLT